MVSKVKQKEKINRKLYKIPKFVAWIFPRRIWFGARDGVCLTFDDGPHPETTPWLLDELKKQNIKATFFWNGIQLEKYPHLLKRAEKEGHVVGHHGYKHQSGKGLSMDEFVNNFDQSKALVNTDFFRPPYGDLSRKQAKYALNHGEIVMWSWMSYDFDMSASTDQLLQKAKKQIQSRDVLIFHENDKTIYRLRDIIPEIIQIIRDKGFSFTQVEKKR